ncbi:aldo/keto reductase [Arthrobacter crystallopoietes]|uniref:2,5-diketo-D-gluconate reductase A n=1 Tax=Crystallibacter crystallopoietes TaxID=37928 RepID=A0A1H1HV58_9MICC|nr:aldo/keto reductase [Arthrobacter crystallopoietes]AUI53769.1 oxidoreductase [Arthrobacter crystallopoietes]SDR29209.1 2,5-diketo-D-gluconate reductase A [Arthrobacter crystallopoietes]
MTFENLPITQAVAVPRLELLHGHSVPRLGLGTWPLLDDECETAVRYAVRAGYRLFDTAFQYRNEKAVGRGVRTAGVPREDLFIASKFNKESHSVDGVQRAYDESLGRMGLDYLDMFMCHWPVPAQGKYVEAWKGLVKLLEEGRVKAIGVSNFKPGHLAAIIEATGVVPDVNQIQLSPDLARLHPRDVHRELGILTEAWSPIGRASGLRENPVVLAIAERLGKTPSQVLLRWHVQQDLVPIPQAAKPVWLEENISVFDFELTPADMEALAVLDRGEAAARDSDSPENGH